MPPLALRLLLPRTPAEKHLWQARQLLCSQDPADVLSALSLLDSILKSFPQWDKAIELKARALLCLRRFKDVANLLQDSIPSLRAANSLRSHDSDADTAELLLLSPSAPQMRKKRRKRRRVPPLLQCFSFFALPRKMMLTAAFHGKDEKEQWRYIVLGQACCHLGMMEDAMILLSNGKRAASGVARKQSRHRKDDDFLTDSACVLESDIVRHLLGNIKLLLRRRAVAIAAFDAGMYTEAIRNFSKIIDGKRGTPQGFISECFMYRAMACEAHNRIVDAIADCNRSLVLNPMSAETLSVRATVYESIGCFAETLRDLEQLRNLYETVFMSSSQQWAAQAQNRDHPADIQGCIDFIASRASSVKERWDSGGGTVDYHRILGVSRGCSRREAERAYMLLAMRHRPDRAAHFVDRCEFVDERDIEAVKDEARASGLNLFKLLQKAYTWVISLILEEEVRRELQSDAVRKQMVVKEDAESLCNLSRSSRDSLIMLHDEGGDNPSLITLTGSSLKLDYVSYEPRSSCSRSVGDDVDVEVFDSLGERSCFTHHQSSTCREEAAAAAAAAATILTISSDAWIAQSHSSHSLSVT